MQLLSILTTAFQWTTTQQVPIPAGDGSGTCGKAGLYGYECEGRVNPEPWWSTAFQERCPIHWAVDGMLSGYKNFQNTAVLQTVKIVVFGDG